jgi:hypothetical protein
MVDKRIYCFWVGNNNIEMNENRKTGLASLYINSKCDVILVDNDNLHTFILEDHPLHEGFQYLSDVHKADYLRTYFMHHYGGGYTDIKPCSWDWNPYFDQLNNDPNSFGIGAPEDEGELSVTLKQRPWLGQHWDKLMTNDLYIFKANTEFTQKWYNKLLEIMDEKLDLLKKHPAKNSREAADTYVTKYPIQWGEILLEIFHPLCYEYTDRLIKTMPCPVTVQYR